jgi:hypothetical protein
MAQLREDDDGVAELTLGRLVLHFFYAFRDS